MTLAGNPVLFPPPEEAALLYVGSVMHARMKPVAHRFRYDVFNLLIDVGRLPEADTQSRLFSIGRFNLAGFDPRDHGPCDGTSLRDYALGVLARAGVDVPDGRVLLLCYPRILGFVFNPISLYFIYEPEGALRGVLYEVRNTFGEKHTYAAAVREGELSPAGLRQDREKLFYVSPFNGMAMRYLFRVLPPGDRLALRILETDAAGPLLSATFKGEKTALSTRNLLRLAFQIPLLTLKVVAGIHIEALQLWWKGMRLVPRPTAPAPISFGDDAHSAYAPNSISSPDTATRTPFRP